MCFSVIVEQSSDRSETMDPYVTIRDLQEEIERLKSELDKTCQEKIQAAEYGLAVLEEKQQLQQQCEDLEVLYDTTKHDLECAKEVRTDLLWNSKLTKRSGILYK